MRWTDSDEREGGRRRGEGMRWTRSDGSDGVTGSQTDQETKRKMVEIWRWRWSERDRLM